MSRKHGLAVSHYCQQVLSLPREELTNLVRPCWTLVANDLAPWVATDGAGDIFTHSSQLSPFEWTLTARDLLYLRVEN